MLLALLVRHLTATSVTMVRVVVFFCLCAFLSTQDDGARSNYNT